MEVSGATPKRFTSLRRKTRQVTSMTTCGKCRTSKRKAPVTLGPSSSAWIGMTSPCIGPIQNSVKSGNSSGPPPGAAVSSARPRPDMPYWFRSPAERK